MILDEVVCQVSDLFKWQWNGNIHISLDDGMSVSTKIMRLPRNWGKYITSNL